MAFSRMLRRVALVRTDVSEEFSASITRVTRIVELETLAVTSNRRAVRSFATKMEALSSSETWSLQEQHGVISQKTPFFMVTVVTQILHSSSDVE
jgi:hypothetical protein